MRDDVGVLWENFCMIERLKYLGTTERHVRSYYWRNSNKREIDLVEEESDSIRAYEIKHGKKRPHLPIEFSRNYPDSSYVTVNPTNFNDILFDKSDPGQLRLIP